MTDTYCLYTILLHCAIYSWWTPTLIELQGRICTKGFGLSDLLGPFLVKYSTQHESYVFMNILSPGRDTFQITNDLGEGSLERGIPV